MDLNINIAIKRSSRKTLSIELKDSKHLLVRAPYNLAENRINDFIEEKRDWIEAHVLKLKEHENEIEPASRLTIEEIQKLADEATRVLPIKVKTFAKQLRVDYNCITIRNQRSRWGSCSAKGNLNFNCLLMLTPESVQDYVVVHELCHRVEMNHSKRFWELVGSIIPDYEKQRSWLQTHGNQIIRRMTG